MGEVVSTDGNGQEHDAVSRVDSTGSVLCDASMSDGRNLPENEGQDCEKLLNE